MNDYASIPIAPGTLLVARPTVEDPYFARSVILMLAHNFSDGSMGIILNRPLEVDHIDHDSPIFGWMESSAMPATIFFGGPVEPDGYICLTDSQQSSSGVVSVDIESTSPVHIDGSHRMFRGYAGWSPGQLENELLLGGWFVVPSVSSDWCSANPDSLWNEVLSRQTGELGRFGMFPVDPHLN